MKLISDMQTIMPNISDSLWFICSASPTYIRANCPRSMIITDQKKKELFGSSRSPCFFLLFPFAFARSRFFSRLLNRKTTRNQPSLRLLNVRSEAGRFNFFCVKSIAIVLTPYSLFFLSPVMVGFLPYTSNYFYPVWI